MRKLSFLVITILLFASSFGTSTILSPRKLKASEVFIPLGNTGQKISLQELSTIRMKDLQTLTGKKISFAEKVSFTIAQRKMRNSISYDGTIENGKLKKLFQKRGGETGFHLGGFALGFFIGLIGVLIAYLINDDYKHNRVKWAWIGFGIGVVISLVISLALMNSAPVY
jgi:hypothetical protein